MSRPPSGAPVLALDIGGTKLAAGLVTPDGEVVNAVRAPTPQGVPADAEVLWATANELLEQARGSVSIAGIGVGCGGPMRWPAGIVSPLNIPAWREFPLRARLVQSYPAVPVRVHNDAVCFAAGEHWVGAGRGHRDMVGLVVSTGVGGGIVLGGRIVDGATGNAGHLGHIVVDPDGPACACGGRGCLEAVASGPASVTWATSEGWSPPPGEVFSGVTLTDSARAGDEIARAALARAGRAVGVALASVAALLDVPRFVIGGGLAEAGSLLIDPARAALAEHARLPYVSGLTVDKAQLGSAAGLIGAGALLLAPGYWREGTSGT